MSTKKCCRKDGIRKSRFCAKESAILATVIKGSMAGQTVVCLKQQQIYSLKVSLRDYLLVRKGEMETSGRKHLIHTIKLTVQQWDIVSPPHMMHEDRTSSV